MVKISINENPLSKVRNDIGNYADTLRNRCIEFVEKMTDVGYYIAVSNSTGTFGKYITISKEFEDTEYGVKSILYATDSGNLTMEFLHGGQADSVDISPLLMIEFGSGLVAENPLGISGVGTGTHSKYGHGTQSGWAYVDLDGNLHKASGYVPHAPMYKALVKMEEEMISIAKEVFG